MCAQLHGRKWKQTDLPLWSGACSKTAARDNFDCGDIIAFVPNFVTGMYTYLGTCRIPVESKSIGNYPAIGKTEFDF